MSRVTVVNVQPANLHGYKGGTLKLTELTPGLNIVYAPNAFGKSTLAKAIGLLFNPEKCDPGALIEGAVLVDETLQELRVGPKGPKFPYYPGDNDAYRHHLVELVTGLTGNDRQAVERLIGSGPVFNPAKVAKPSTDKAKLARKELLEARKAKADLAQSEDRLPFLRQSLETAKKAGGQVGALEAILDWKSRLQEYAACREAIDRLQAEFPGIERQSENAYRDAVELQRQLDGAAAEIQRATDKLATCSPSGDVPARALLQADRAELQDLGERWRVLRAEQEAVRGEIEGLLRKAQTARDQVLQAMGSDPDALPPVTSDDLQEFTLVLDQFDSRHAASLQTAANEAVAKGWLESNGPFERNVESAIRALADWLKQEPALDPPKAPILLLGVAACCTLAAAALPELILRLPLAVVAICLVVFAELQRKQPAVSLERPPLPVLPSGVRSPEPNVPSVVEALLDSLSAQSRRQVYELLRARAGSAAEPFSWGSVSASAKLKCDNPLILGATIRALEAYQQGGRDIQEAKGREDKTVRVADETESRCAALLSGYGFESSAVSLPSRLNGFFAWMDAGTELNRSRTEVSEREAAFRKFLQCNGIEVNHDLAEAMVQLAARQRLVQQWKAQTDELRMLERLIAEPHDPWALVEGLFEGAPIEEVGTERLQEQLEQRQLRAAEFEKVLRNVNETELEIAKAEREFQIQEKEAAYQEAVQALDTRHQAFTLSRIKQIVHTSIQKRLSTQVMPKVIQRATEYLGRFSGGRYCFEIGYSNSERLGHLVVKDLQDGPTREFHELSTGTKVHTILAFKLAQLDEQEEKENRGAYKFPLLADEALAVSDADASRQIACALVEISQERQVIVFTNQTSDLALFEEVDPTSNRIMLGTAALNLPDVPAVPPPLRRAPATYVIDPRWPIGAHSIPAIFPQMPGELREIRVDEGVSPREDRAFVQRLENVRKALNATYPRLSWHEVEKERWARTEASEQLKQKLEEAAGCPYRFIVSARSLLGRQFQRRHHDQLVDCLRAKGYLDREPTLESVVDCIENAFMEEPDPLRRAQAITIFTAQYVSGSAGDTLL